jgi:hypothetical protein
LFNFAINASALAPAAAAPASGTGQLDARGHHPGHAGAGVYRDFFRVHGCRPVRRREAA